MEKKQKEEFSKFLLKQEALLIWIMSISFIILAFYCIAKGFTGTLPWLAAMVGFPWSAYGVSQAFYYTKAKAENTTGGIKYETVLAEKVQQAIEPLDDFENFDINNFISNNNSTISSYTAVIGSTEEYQI